MPKRKKQLQNKIGAFLRQYQRKANPGWDPNDRQYDREIEEKIKNMNPEELSELMSGDESDITPEVDEKWFNSGPIAGVGFYLNDAVIIIKGKHINQKGSVISLLNIKPEPRYFIELSDGESVIVVESQLNGL